MKTSRASRPVSPAFMPLSIASWTSRRPITGPAAPSIAITPRNATRPRCPGRYRPRRVNPVRLCGKDLVSEQLLEEPFVLHELGGDTVLDDLPVHEHHSPVGNLYRR